MSFEMEKNECYNLPRLNVNYQKRENLYNRLIQSFERQGCNLVAVKGQPGSGKTSLAVFFAKCSTLFEKVVFLNANSAEKLNCEYRIFAREYLGIQTISKLSKSQLNQVVRDRIKSFRVLFIFDDLVSLNDCEEFLNDSTSNQLTLITTRNENFVHESTRWKVNLIDQDMFNSREAISHLNSATNNFYDAKKIQRLVQVFVGSSRDEILPYDVEKLIVLLKSHEITIDDLLITVKRDLSLIRIIIEKLLGNDELSIDLLSYFILLDSSFIPCDLLSSFYTNRNYEKALEKLKHLSMVEMFECEVGKCIRLSSKTFNYLKKNSENFVNLKSNYLILIQTLSKNFPIINNSSTKVKYNQLLNYSHLISCLNRLNDDADDNVRSIKRDLAYKISLFYLNYVNDDEKALEMLEKCSQYSTTEDKSLMAKIHFNRGKCFDKLSKYDDGINEKKKSLKLTRELNIGKHMTVQILESLAYSYAKKELVDRAIEFDQEALEIKLELKKNTTSYNNYEKDLDKSIAKSYYNIGDGHFRNENYELALENFWHSFEMRDQLYAKRNDQDLCDVLNALVETYKRLGHGYEEALVYCKELSEKMKSDLEKGIVKRDAFVLDKMRKKEPSDDSIVIQTFRTFDYIGKKRSKVDHADVLYRTALSLYNQQDYKQSLRNLQEAYEIYQAYSKEEQSAYCLDKIGMCYLKLLKLVESYDYLVRAFNKRKQIYGKNAHPDVIISLTSLASYYESIGNFDLSNKYKAEAYKQSESLTNDNNLDYATSLNNLGISYLKMGDLKLGVEYLSMACKIRKRVYADMPNGDLACSMFNLGVANLKLDKLNKALEYAKESLQMRRKLYETEDREEIADTLNFLGMLYFKLKEYEASKRYLLQAFEMRKKIYHEAHPNVANTLYNLGAVYEKLGDSKKSSDCFSKFYKLKKLTFEKKNNFLYTRKKSDSLLNDDEY